MDFRCQIVEIEKFTYFYICWLAKKSWFLFWYLGNFSPLLIVENIFSYMERYGTLSAVLQNSTGGAVQSYWTEQNCQSTEYKVVQSAVQFSSKLQSYWNAFIIVAKQSSAEVHFF